MIRSLLIFSLLGIAFSQLPIEGFRPPAVPLIVMNPYMSIWSMASNLTDSFPQYWPGTIKAFVGLIRIDGTPYRFMSPGGDPIGSTPPIQQSSVTVYPTRTVYVFNGQGIELTLTFMTPLLTDDIELLSRPVTYITWKVASTDGKSHSVQLYYDNTAEIAVNDVTEKVLWNRVRGNDLNIMSIGTSAQNFFDVVGDGVGINWGYAYVATPNVNTNGIKGVKSVMIGSAEARQMFVQSGDIPNRDDNRMPRPCNDDWPVLAYRWDMNIAASSSASSVVMFAYDQVLSIKWFGNPLEPYWRHYHDDIVELMNAAFNDYAAVEIKCQNFDNQLLQKANQVGGPKYATMAALAYRQTLGGCQMTKNPDPTKTDPWYFMKEISSDGDVSTVDVIFPASPFFLYFSTDLLKKLILPILQYANNETTVTYDYVFAPHHLGTWPVAYILSQDQEDMPIEETGNLLMMIAGIALKEGNVDFVYPHYWPLMEQWANYLITALPDPENQLCTDDFEGPIPHDANLAVKGIVGLDCFALMSKILGNNTAAQHYSGIAKNYAQQWIKLANPEMSNHYRLRYDKPGFSLKYNLLFQKILGMDTFPQSVFDQEVNYYMSIKQPYGVPLDNRHLYTKLDWESWIAAISSNSDQFNFFVNSIYAFADNTPNRVPLSDWYDASTSRQQGFQARTVVGGIYAKMVTPLKLNST